MCDTLTKKKDDLLNELNKLKYQGQDEITRKEIEDVNIHKPKFFTKFYRMKKSGNLKTYFIFHTNVAK